MCAALETQIRDECDKGGFYAEWEALFSKPVICADVIRSRCFSGQLQGSKLRSLYWRILLQCLPLNRSGWQKEVESARKRYTELRQKYICDPRDAKEACDLAVNNPLSLKEESPWQQYFDDQELKGSIIQDVERTFPELEYFQSVEVRAMMVDLLFVYARVYPNVEYKQGMHEILGPLLFVLYSDLQSYTHACEGYCIESKDCLDTLALLLSPQYLAHDSFHMFCQVMRILTPWYCAPETPPGQSRTLLPVGEEPFARPQDNHPSNALVVKLNRIGDGLLKKIDPPLYKHLDNFEIAPQIYGIRWLRLLFGREFPIQDLLFLWDAIFSDGAPFHLVDFIFVAMLVSIRDLLLHSDYTGCLHYLMRYPPISDVHSLLSLALHLIDPNKFPKPKSQAITNFSHITISGSPHPNKLYNHENAMMTNSSRVNAKSGLEKTGAKMLQSINKMGNLMADSFKDDIATPVDPLGVSTSVPTRPASLSTSQKLAGNKMNKPSAFASPLRKSTNENKKNKVNETIGLLQEQISCLQVRVNDVEALARFAADKLDVCSDVLESELHSCELNQEREGFRALTDLRRLARLMRNPAPVANAIYTEKEDVNIESSPEDVSCRPSPDSELRSSNIQSPVEIGTDPARMAGSNAMYVYNEMKDMTANGK